MFPASSTEQRIRMLISGARRLADPDDALGREARRVLPETTGLSVENVDMALRECLETEIDAAALHRLIDAATPSPRAHVILPANVFIAPHRALVLALAASATVYARPSRREPVFAQLLHRAAPGLFEIVTELEPSWGDQLWAYGADATLAEIEASLPTGVLLHAHGSGTGVVAVDERELRQSSDEDLRVLCDGIALDVALFDQRGCLSPRLVLIRADEKSVKRFGERLLTSLASIEARIPSGSFSANERAEAAWYRENLSSVGEWFPLEQGSVGVTAGALELIPPSGRHVHLCVVDDLAAAVASLAPLITTLGHSPLAHFYAPLHALLPGARYAEPGKMQRPPLDGPVDRRVR